MRLFDCGLKKREFSTVALDPAGRWVASGGGANPTVIWDIATGTGFVGFHHKHLSPTADLQVTTDGRLVSLTADGLLAFTPTGTVTPIYAEPRQVIRAALDASGAWAVCSHILEDFSTRLIALADPGLSAQHTVWSVGVGEELTEHGYAQYLACLGDGARFLSVEHLVQRQPVYDDRYRIAVRSRADGRVLDQTATAFSFGDRVFAAHTCDTFVLLSGGHLRAHRVDDPRATPHVVRNDGKKHFTAAAFHPSGNHLLVTSNDATVKLYDVRSWAVARTFTWDIGRMRSVTFSADGTLAAAGGDSGKVVVWDVDV
jgi:WD40 repeat protein